MPVAAKLKDRDTMQMKRDEDNNIVRRNSIKIGRRTRVRAVELLEVQRKKRCH